MDDLIKYLNFSNSIKRKSLLTEWKVATENRPTANETRIKKQTILCGSNQMISLTQLSAFPPAYQVADF